MKMLSFGEFLMETAGGSGSPLKQMDIYENHPFKCSCGKEHQFKQWELKSIKNEPYIDVYQVKIIRTLPKMCFVFQCPDDPHYLTYVHIKGLLWFKGFDSLFGTKIEEALYEHIDFLYENARQVFDASILMADVRGKRADGKEVIDVSRILVDTRRKRLDEGKQ